LGTGLGAGVFCPGSSINKMKNVAFSPSEYFARQLKRKIELIQRVPFNGITDNGINQLM
jgi:hypothetical protein